MPTISKVSEGNAGEITMKFTFQYHKNKPNVKSLFKLKHNQNHEGKS